MAERPTLFSAPMVRALRAGLKWQTRRLMKPQPMAGETISAPPSGDGSFLLERWPEAGRSMLNFGRCEIVKPPCLPGDVLWVREAWRTGSNFDKWSGKKIQEAAMESGYYRKGSLNACCPIWYEADGAYQQWGDDDISDFGKKGRYRHARFMPRWACRDTYAVLSVRAERLQDITEADAIAEGVQPWPYNPDQTLTSGERAGDSPYRSGYALLWDEINDERATWKSNQFVWVIEYDNPARKLVNAQEGK